MQNILLNAYRPAKNLYVDSLAFALGKFECFSVSDWRNVGDLWFGQYLYDAKYDNTPDLSDAELKDIIRRDRSLRIMDPERAKRIVRRLWSGIGELYARNNFSYLITTACDRASTDILLRHAYRNGIPAASPLSSFMKGYCYFTTRGEWIPIGNHPSNEEVADTMCSLVSKDFIPHSEKRYPKRMLSHRALMLRRYCVEKLYNPLIMMLDKDPDHLHYNTFNFKNLTLSDIFLTDFNSYFERIEDVAFDRTRTVYLPLHYYPEATTDYFSDGISEYGYLAYLVSLIERSESDITFLIKEHPSMMRSIMRERGFYETLLSYPNVHLIHPFDSSNTILESCDNVAVSVGTIGVEALLRNKRVLALEKSYYSSWHPNVIETDHFTKEILNQSITVYDNKLLIEKMLSCCFKSDYLNNKHQAHCSVEELGRGFKSLFENQRLQ